MCVWNYLLLIKSGMFVTQVLERNFTHTFALHFKLRDRHMKGYNKNLKFQVSQDTILSTNKATYCHTTDTRFKIHKIQTLKLLSLRNVRYQQYNY